MCLPKCLPAMLSVGERLVILCSVQCDDQTLQDLSLLAYHTELRL